MDILIGNLKAFPIEMGGGVRRERVRTQWGGYIAIYVCVYNGERGLKFLLLWCVGTNWMTS